MHGSPRTIQTRKTASFGVERIGNKAAESATALGALGVTAMVEGERVRLKLNSQLATQHPELADAVGTVSSIFASSGKRLLHVRYTGPANFVALHVPEDEFEAIDRLVPRLKAE